MERLRFFVLVAAVLAWAACRAPSVQDQVPATDPDIRGEITQVEADQPLARFLVEEHPQDTVGSMKAYVRLLAETTLWEETDAGRRRVDPSALATGRRAAVWFDGTVLESYPLQAGARVVLLEKAP